MKNGSEKSGAVQGVKLRQVCRNPDGLGNKRIHAGKLYGDNKKVNTGNRAQ